MSAGARRAIVISSTEVWSVVEDMPRA